MEDERGKNYRTNSAYSQLISGLTILDNRVIEGSGYVSRLVTFARFEELHNGLYARNLFTDARSRHELALELHRYLLHAGFQVLLRD